MAARQRRFYIRVYLLLDRLPSLVDEPYLPEASGFEASNIPAFAPSPVSINALATGRPGAGLELGICMYIIYIGQAWHKHTGV